MGQQLSQVAFWNPARCVTLWHLGSVLATYLSCHFRFPKSQTCVVSVTMRERLRYWLIQSRAKLSKQLLAKQWLGAKVANFWTGGAARKQVPVLYGNDRPALAHHEFWHNFILSHVGGMEKYRCFLGTTRENLCSLSTQNAKGKRQSGIVLSLPGRGFEPRTLTT